ncbi:NAD(P)/FAD-dependent oxidoreductase [Nonomuraea jiangxiensis]|uniref:3-phenylpropionate/trans-cinnamate dioxygenase ferredoxin reductase subunit n=1 Tax=Nonomuraea jiangxiensis TaxID=633440 RepID=A0A1G9SNV4_9ACTN|nr:FAD-dependent oxidoreductase [Nonomuraea jiangxiensis]SDM37139.1 3-phenylpropionate/trans-cinnamate dioxygenase ferredoxin reductase subunit [Nonomuraea jiangxiensis]
MNSSDSERVGTLIVGASQAGLQVATSLRELGATDPITLIGGEARPPYQRPPLSKRFLQGDLPEHRLALRGEDFYASNAIELICGEWIETIRLTDPAAGTGEALTRSGRRLAFTGLALTVGGTPRRMRVPGHHLAGIHYLRDVDDALGLRHDLAAAERVVVVGGGFVGLEAAAGARAAGKDVTVVEAADRLMARAVAPVVSDFYAEAHRRRGTAVRLGAMVTAFTGDEHVQGVQLSDGAILPADVVVVGIGLEPRTELAEQLGLRVDRGIVVDADARTSNPAIVAAGDCTVLPHPLTRRGQVRIESVQNAVSQAQVAAASLLGLSRETRSVPWFWSDQADLKLQIAGLSAGYDECVVRGDPATEQFSVFYYKTGRLIASDSVNAPRDYMVVRKVLGDGGTLPPDRVGDESVSLKDLMRPSTSTAVA